MSSLLDLTRYFHLPPNDKAKDTKRVLKEHVTSVDRGVKIDKNPPKITCFLNTLYQSILSSDYHTAVYKLIISLFRLKVKYIKYITILC